MEFKRHIQDRGLKIRFVADKIQVNPNTLRVYLNDDKKMTETVSNKLKGFLSVN